MFSLRTLLSTTLRISPPQVQSLSKFKIPRETTFFQRRQCSDNKLKFEDEPEQQEDSLEKKFALGKLNLKMKLSFTCKKCSTRTHKTISKTAYEKGLVIVRCDGCKNNHLIADNLGWFYEFKGQFNIENFLKKKGETVLRMRNHSEGYFEAIAKDEFDRMVQGAKNEEERHRVEKNSES